MLKMKKKNFVILLIVVFFLGVGITLGGSWFTRALTGSIVVPKSEYMALTNFAKDFDKLYEVDRYVSASYLWDYDKDKLDEALSRKFVSLLGDKYSTYMNQKEYKAWNDELSGSFYGVGVTFVQEKGKYIVKETIEGSPARKAGFVAGDVLLTVNGKTYKNQDDMAAAIRGEKGTEVKIEYMRGKTHKVATMIREEIVVESVTSQVMNSNIGYIRISSFDENTGKDFENELAEMENKGVKGLIIDLRLNGGGYVDECVKVADALLPACTITSMTDKNGKKKSFDSDASCTDLPYVLLVDGGTASASEILAGAVQDNKGGKIVGTKTFGKGIVQSTFELTDKSCVKLTTMEYLTPLGNKVHKLGITPDYIVNLKANSNIDYQLNKAIELLK